ncbi:MAG: rRNA (guanosine-2-O-)-methyltransferase RlmB [Planctomycetota bacterium]|jgi:23S rRNA (guanosine2251-2'-O)-methyltransferase
MLELRNPHSILAAIQRRPRAVKSLRLQSNQPPEPWDALVNAARQKSIPITVNTLDDRRGPRRDTERVGAGSALVEPPSPVPLEQLLQPPPGTGRGLWLALDQIQDPQNLGALFRLAGFFGVAGIVLTKDRSAPVNATVCDVATGGVECVPFSTVANLAQTLQRATDASIWVLGTCERAAVSIHQIPRDRPWMLVLGNEGTGLRRLSRERCDQLASLPPLGPVPSLNVATAAAACLAVLTQPQ